MGHPLVTSNTIFIPTQNHEIPRCPSARKSLSEQERKPASYRQLNYENELLVPPVIWDVRSWRETILLSGILHLLPVAVELSVTALSFSQVFMPFNLVSCPLPNQFFFFPRPPFCQTIGLFNRQTTFPLALPVCL